MAAVTAKSRLPARFIREPGPEYRDARRRATGAEGPSNTEIVARLYLRETTVKSHIVRIIAKLGGAGPGGGRRLRLRILRPFGAFGDELSWLGLTAHKRDS